MSRIRPASLVAPEAQPAPRERWASLEDPYITGYAPSLTDGEEASYGEGPQLIDHASAVAGLSGGSLWTSLAGESLVTVGASAPAARSRVRAAQNPSGARREAGSSRSVKRGSGATAKLLISAYSLTGRPYKPGQSSPQSGFDNSGYVSYVYSQSGVRLPRGKSAAELAAAGKPVSKDDLRPGDLVVYSDVPKSGGGYILGVYSGNGNILLASPRLSAVTETAAFGTDYGPYFVGARRLYEDPAAEPLSEEEKMAATNGAVKVALAQLGELPRLQPISSSSSRSYSKSKSKGRYKSKARASSGKSKSGKKAYSRGSKKSGKAKAAPSKSRARRVVKKKR
jgi:cell wall-associated NlpC family hydrolase